MLNLSERGLADDKLIHLLSNTPERSFVLIEDIDAAFNKRVQTSADGYQSSVTFSGFLNALDGVASGEERIIFMTTNHPERLDPALIRPGRVDLSVLINDASPQQARRLFERFYGRDETLDTPAVVGAQGQETDGWERISEVQLRELAHQGGVDRLHRAAGGQPDRPLRPEAPFRQQPGRHLFADAGRVGELDQGPAGQGVAVSGGAIGGRTQGLE